MDIDVTLFMQLGIICLLMLLLRPLLVAPLLQVLEGRHQQTFGARAEVRRMDRLSAADKEAYEAKMARARHEVHRRRESQRQAGRDQARQIDQAARQEAQQTLASHRQSLQRAEAEAYGRLAGESPARAQALAARLLGREVTP